MHILKGFSYVRMRLGVKALQDLILGTASPKHLSRSSTADFASGSRRTRSRGTRLLVQDPEWDTTEPFKSSKIGKNITLCFQVLGITGQPKSRKAQVTAPAALAGAHWLFPYREKSLHLNVTWFLIPQNPAREANYSDSVSI